MSESTVAVVTGATGALGRATVDALGTAGWTVVGVGRDRAALDALPGDVPGEVADVSEPADVSAALDRVADRFGAPSVLVHTVGGFAPGTAMDATPETLRRMLDLNVGAALWTSQAAARHMRQRGGGAIVFVAARNGVEPVPGAAAYGVSKAALVHLTRVLDVEWKADGIRVNAVVPRLIDTAANRAALSGDAMARAVTPAAIAEVIAFLVSDAAASISGAAVPVYGTA
jgi:NAD(P)-dependent dehydrogenase (short-subunit alcohol dehydrogenase family)